MIDPHQSSILNQIAGEIAARHASTAQNLVDIKDDFITEVVSRFGDGTITIPSREQIVSEIYWRHVDNRAKNRGQKIVRDWLRGQTRICYEADFTLMVRVSKHRRTTLALYSASDLEAYGAESANNRSMIVASDDELQAQLASKVALLRQYGDLGHLHEAGLIDTLDDADEASA